MLQPNTLHKNAPSAQHDLTVAAMSFQDILIHLPMVAWLAVALLSCYGLYDCISTLKPPPQIASHPKVALIIPVRGAPPNFDLLWQSICSQTLAAGRVIFAVESENDPATQAIRALPDGPPRDIVIAGPTALRAQKIHNLIAAIDDLSTEDEIVVFADADIVPDKDWLLRLVAPLSEPDIRIVSGYRWMIPSDDRWSSALVCVANASIATVPRLPLWNLAWGGSTALRRDTLGALDLARLWDRSAVDDLSITSAARQIGYHIAQPQSLLVPSPTAMSWREVIAFGRRQYLFTRLYTPTHWALAAAATTLPLIGWAVALPLALSGSKFAIATIIAANVFDQIRAGLRRRVSRILWATEMPARMAWLDRWATPVWLAFHAAIIWSTLFGRWVFWAGRTYRIDQNGRVARVIETHADAAQPASVGQPSSQSSRKS